MVAIRGMAHTHVIIRRTGYGECHECAEAIPNDISLGIHVGLIVSEIVENLPFAALGRTSLMLNGMSQQSYSPLTNVRKRWIKNSSY